MSHRTMLDMIRDLKTVTDSSQRDLQLALHKNQAAGETLDQIAILVGILPAEYKREEHTESGYVCPQHGLDLAGAEAHAERFHVFPPRVSTGPNETLGMEQL
jgi:hypothetical protein